MMMDFGVVLYNGKRNKLILLADKISSSRLRDKIWYARTALFFFLLTFSCLLNLLKSSPKIVFFTDVGIFWWK